MIITQAQIDHIEELIESSWNIRKGDLNGRLAFAQSAIDASIETGYQRGLAYGYRNRGAILKLLDNCTESIADLERALRIFNEMNDAEGLAATYTQLGIAYQDCSSYAKALENLLEAKQLFESIKDQNGVARTITNIGNLYLRLKQYDDATSMFEEASKLHLAVENKRGLVRAQCNLGLAYLRLGRFNEALELVLKAIPHLQLQGLNLDICSAIATAGEIYRALGHNALSDQYYLQAWQIAMDHDFKRGKCALSILLGRVELEKKNFKKAEEWFNLCIELANGGGYDDQRQNALLGLSEVFHAQGEFERAYDSLRGYTELRDSFTRSHYRDMLGVRQIRWKHEQEEKDHQWLEMKNLELQNANIELARMNDDKDEILRIVSHDMRTPLGTIIGMGNLIRTEGAESEDEMRNMGSLIEESGLRLLGLVNGLLEIAHSESDAFQLDAMPTNVHDLLENIVHMY